MRKKQGRNWKINVLRIVWLAIVIFPLNVMLFPIDTALPESVNRFLSPHRFESIVTLSFVAMYLGLLVQYPKTIREVNKFGWGTLGILLVFLPFSYLFNYLSSGTPMTTLEGLIALFLTSVPIGLTIMKWKVFKRRYVTTIG